MTVHKCFFPAVWQKTLTHNNPEWIRILVIHSHNVIRSQKILSVRQIKCLLLHNNNLEVLMFSVFLKHCGDAPSRGWVRVKTHGCNDPEGSQLQFTISSLDWPHTSQNINKLKRCNNLLTVCPLRTYGRLCFMSTALSQHLLYCSCSSMGYSQPGWEINDGCWPNWSCGW